MVRKSRFTTNEKLEYVLGVYYVFKVHLNRLNWFFRKHPFSP